VYIHSIYGQEEPVTDGIQASKDRSRRLYEEIFGRGNYAAADELLAADVISHGPGVPPTVGTEGIKRGPVGSWRSR
jgi:hypothetical protein